MTERVFQRSLTFSFLLHALVVLVFFLWGKFVGWESISDKYTAPVWIDLVPSKSEPERTRKIVDSKEGKETEAPDESAFLGEKNLKVEKELVAKESGDGALKKKQAEARPQKEIAKKGAGAKIKDLRKLGIAYFPTAKDTNVDFEDANENFENNTDLFVDDWAGSGLSPYDFVEGIEEGDKTALNTKEFVYFSYFERIRKQLDQAWKKKLKNYFEKLYSKGRYLASGMNHTTRVLVSLNEIGAVVKVEVLEASGTRDLDSAATDAFNKAGPFPNPPKKLIEKENGTIKIQWDFILRT